jgi:hypothetical protein
VLDAVALAGDVDVLGVEAVVEFAAGLAFLDVALVLAALAGEGFGDVDVLGAAVQVLPVELRILSKIKFQFRLEYYPC